MTGVVQNFLLIHGKPVKSETYWLGRRQLAIGFNSAWVERDLRGVRGDDRLWRLVALWDDRVGWVSVATRYKTGRVLSRRERRVKWDR